MQRLQPWSGWGGSFRGALPGEWGGQAGVPTASTRSSGSRSQAGTAVEVTTTGSTRRHLRGLGGKEGGERERDRAGELQSVTRGVAVGPSSPALRSGLQIVTPELALGCYLASLHPSVWST